MPSPRRVCLRPLALTLCLMCVGGTVSPAPASEPPPAASPADAENSPPVSLTEQEIATLVSRLEDPEFEVREEASRKLAAGGAAVVPAMEQGTESDSLEVATRCLGVLKTLLEGKDVDAQADAAIALKRLCNSPNPAIARRAAAMIDPPQNENPLPGQLPGVRINLRGLPQGGGARQMQVSNNNGQIQVSVVEGDRKIRISHRNGADISVEITEPGAAGQPAETRKFQAKTEEDLKSKHPDAFKLYEEYGKQGDADIFAGDFPGRAFPPGVIPPMRRRQPPRGFRNAVPPGRKTITSLQAVDKQLEKIVNRLNELSTSKTPNPEELRKLADEVTRIQGTVTEAAREIE